jgi:hypothetical protein
LEREKKPKRKKRNFAPASVQAALSSAPVEEREFEEEGNESRERGRERG